MTERKGALKGGVVVCLAVIAVANAGIVSAQDKFPSRVIRIVTAAIDRDLSENFYIRPGLGDMGDRLFGTA